jgi:radical SAM superfamily enzyme YgiQ (UPF0313 family)
MSWRIALQAGATVLSPSRDEVIAFDLEGRPKSWFLAGTLIKRSLASELHARRTEGGVRRRWRVEEGAVDGLFERARALALRATHEATDELPVVQRPQLAERVARIADWTPARLRDEAERFAEAYAPISILPPDQYGAIVVQGTFGCSWNRCSFCSFYQNRPFELRPEGALTAHLEAVSDLLGRDAETRRSLFLADGNALVLSNGRLRPLFELSRSTFPGRPMASFVDVFSGEKKSLADYRELREWGLTQVAVGLETGHDPLLEFIRKPGGADAAVEFIATLKAARLRVAVIFMVGVGGERYAAGHQRDSLALIARLPLAPRDIVYLSPFVLQRGSAYAEAAEREAIPPLSEAALAAQQAALERAVRRSHPLVQVARYPIEEFIY